MRPSNTPHAVVVLNLGAPPAPERNASSPSTRLPIWQGLAMIGPIWPYIPVQYRSIGCVIDLPPHVQIEGLPFPMADGMSNGQNVQGPI